MTKHYIILPRDPRLTAVDGAHEATVRERVRELSGSDVLGYESVRRKLTREGIVYVAVRSTGDRERFGRGFLVVDVRNQAACERADILLRDVMAAPA